MKTKTDAWTVIGDPFAQVAALAAVRALLARGKDPQPDALVARLRSELDRPEWAARFQARHKFGWWRRARLRRDLHDLGRCVGEGRLPGVNA